MYIEYIPRIEETPLALLFAVAIVFAILFFHPVVISIILQEYRDVRAEKARPTSPPKLGVCSQDEAERGFHRAADFEGAHLIAISDLPLDRGEKERLEKRYADVLYLDFYDLSYENMVDEYYNIRNDITNVFSMEQARAVVDFALKHKGEDLLVFCTAGMSRSQAVGLFILKHIRNDTQAFNELYHSPYALEGGNHLVYHLLVRAWLEKTDNRSDVLEF